VCFLQPPARKEWKAPPSCAKLAEEYELKERGAALERKLDLVSRSAGVLVDLLQNRRALRVEWYIVLLILIEILLYLYEMFLRR
jgi:required for meiotic nuclear division protein 1